MLMSLRTRPHDKDVDEHMQDRETVVKVFIKSLLKCQNQMKQQTDIHRSKRVFETNSLVYLKLQPYMQNSLKVHKHSKLNIFWAFPYMEKVDNVAEGY